MKSNRPKNKINLRKTALELFQNVFQKIDAERVIFDSLKVRNSTLSVGDKTWNLSDFSEIYVVSLGKAGKKMAVGLNKILAERITGGVVSAPETYHKLLPCWQIFTGGHPVPNKESLAAAQASIELLKRANHPKSLIIFLISGGGSAMVELPKDPKISLEDLRKTNQILVNCGAPIKEVNNFRRTISQIKGGGLGQIAPLAQKISLIISDTNPGDTPSVASGPTIKAPNGENPGMEALDMARNYGFKNLLPISIIKFLESYKETTLPSFEKITNHTIYTLLDNRTALNEVAESVEKMGFETEIADDLLENPIAEGCRELVKRLLKLQEKSRDKPVAIISGGEFVCPVKGNGVGGRNLETTLRCLLEIKERATENFDFAILSAGTDGIDGNSPAAGAIADSMSLVKAGNLGLNPYQFLENSDSYSFFQLLGDMIITGPTGTNVRDLRILLAR